MDVHCTTCGEPWDTYHLWHDAIHETDLERAEIEGWRKLPQAKRLSEKYRAAFKDAGYEFGSSVINVTRCPACPAGAQPDAEKLGLKTMLEDLLDGDEDGLAAKYEDLGL